MLKIEMDFSMLLQVCHLTLVIHSIDGYLLLAANLDDFKTLAKQIIPEKFAERLANIASDSPFVNRNDRVDRGKYTTEYEDSKSISAERARKVLNKPRIQKTDKVKENTHSVDVEKIIRKIKQRLEKEYKLKPVKTDDKYEKYEEKSEERHYKYREIAKKPNNKRHEKYTDEVEGYNERLNENHDKHYEDYKFHDTVVTKNDRLKYNKVSKKKISIEEDRDDVYKGNRKPNTKRDRERNNEKYEEVNGGTEIERDTKIDTYEDESVRYNDKLRPHKLDRDRNQEKVNGEDDKNANLDRDRKLDDNKDADEEIFKQVPLGKNNDSYEDYVTPAKDLPEDMSSQDIRNRHREKVAPEIDTGDNSNIKARTESLIYDYKEDTSPSEVSAKQPKGTMIPTKEHYKMSSPNYYAKLPVVAEKYDFNEPIPEKDREPENLSNIGNPPASINKKTKL